MALSQSSIPSVYLFVFFSLSIECLIRIVKEAGAGDKGKRSGVVGGK